MSFDPNQLLNNPASLLTLQGQAAKRPATEAAPEPVPPPPYDRTMYENAYGRLGLLRIANVVDLGCGPGNFTGVMVSRRQKPEVYLGVDMSHNSIRIAKAAYPGWNFIYGDFLSPGVRQQYERYEGFLLLNMMDVMEDELAFLDTVPSQKPVLFSMPRFPKEGSLRYYDDMTALRDRYSNHLSIKSVGRLSLAQGQSYSMVVGVRW
ncbi:MAG: methyltransferase domain-containing protein [Deltaproteobacteria bacterium]|jgi:trans-aconitate methyltransferase|nr:methyltransferase domain-containing protein [Deltaproteobacteria bacterium]